MEGENTQDNSNQESNQNPFIAFWSKPQSPTNEESGGGGDSRNSEEKYKRYEYRISVINTIVNALVGLFTILLFFLAFSQNEEVEKSARAAIDAANEAKRSSDIARDQYNLSVKLAKESSEEAKERFKLDSLNAQAQIRALQEQVHIMKEQFRIENEPRLFVEPSSMIDLESKPFVFEYKIGNNANSTVHIIETKGAFQLSDKPTKKIFEDAEKVINSSGGNFDITRSAVVVATDPIREMPPIAIENIKNNKWKFFWLVIVFYEDPITKETKKQPFLMEIVFRNSTKAIDFNSYPIPK